MGLGSIPSYKNLHLFTFTGSCVRIPWTVSTDILGPCTAYNTMDRINGYTRLAIVYCSLCSITLPVARYLCDSYTGVAKEWKVRCLHSNKINLHNDSYVTIKPTLW